MRLPREAYACCANWSSEIVQVVGVWVDPVLGGRFALIIYPNNPNWTWREHPSNLRGPARELAEALLAEVES